MGNSMACSAITEYKCEVLPTISFCGPRRATVMTWTTRCNDLEDMVMRDKYVVSRMKVDMEQHAAPASGRRSKTTLDATIRST
eukprot:3118027-Prymnesium_polylepis.2